MANNTAKRRVSLSSYIEEKTVFVYGLDFKFIELKHPTRRRPDPKEFVILKIMKTNSVRILEKRRVILEALEEQRINIQDEKLLYIELPPLTNSLKNFSETATNIELSKKLDSLNEKMAGLIKAHCSLGILGKKNTDQPEFMSGIVNFNYFDQPEADRAFAAFGKLGLTLEKRPGKKCNLSFMLEDPIDTSKLNPEKRDFNGKIIEACLWILKKIYGKTLLNLPNNTNFGISERCRVGCDEIGMAQIKKELEEYYGILIILNNGGPKTSEFFILTGQKAKDIYYKHKGKISVPDLIKEINGPTSTPKKEIKITKTDKKEKKMDKLSKFLPAVIRKILKEAGLNLTQPRGEKKSDTPYLQIYHKGNKKVKIAINLGTQEDKKALIEKVKMLIQENYFGAHFSDGKKWTTVTVFIPGFENPPPRKKRAKKPLKVGSTVHLEKRKKRPYIRKPKLDTINPLSAEEIELKKMIDNPELSTLLVPEVWKQITSYFEKKEVNERAKSLLAQLNN